MPLASGRGKKFSVIVIQNMERLSCKQLIEEITSLDGKLAYSNTQDNKFSRSKVKPGEINTDFNHSYTFGLPAPQISVRRRDLECFYGPKKLDITSIFRRPRTIDWLDQLKSGPNAVENYQAMLDDSAGYLASALKGRVKFDQVSPVPSSKPLASDWAKAISQALGVPYKPLNLTKTGVAKDSHVSQRGSEKRYKWGQESAVKGLMILLVDDLTTTDSTLVQVAELLYNQRAEYVYACALVGPTGTVESRAARLVAALTEGDGHEDVGDQYRKIERDDLERIRTRQKEAGYETTKWSFRIKIDPETVRKNPWLDKIANAKFSTTALSLNKAKGNVLYQAASGWGPIKHRTLVNLETQGLVKLVKV